MDKLFGQREAFLHAAKAQNDRVAARSLIEQYNERIKRSILDLYANKGKCITRLIAIADTVRACPDLSALEALKAEAAALQGECSLYCSQTLKDRELCIFNNWNDRRTITFPRGGWEIDIIQEWCDYWQSGMLLGGSTRYKNHEWGKVQNKQEQVVAHWVEFKSREIHVDIWKTVSECKAWRERFQLTHLDALALHATNN